MSVSIALALLLPLLSCPSDSLRDSGQPLQELTIKNPTPMQTAAKELYHFEDTAQSSWYIQDDGVMGGKSKGEFVVKDGALEFKGVTVTQGGGFSSVLVDDQHDLREASGVRVRVKGDGRTYDFAIKDSFESNGREVWRQKSFDTSEGWVEIDIPFSSLKAQAHGEDVAAPPLNLADVQSLGFYIIDGQDGPFCLQIDQISSF